VEVGSASADITEIQAVVLGATPNVISFLPTGAGSTFVAPGSSGVGGPGAAANAGRWYFGLAPGYANSLHAQALSDYLLLAFPDGAIANSQQQLVIVFPQAGLQTPPIPLVPVPEAPELSAAGAALLLLAGARARAR
jgi:hypothetical protein